EELRRARARDRRHAPAEVRVPMERASDWDVVVVGGGLGGLSAANRAAESGLKVAVLERGAETQYPCNSRYSGGILHIAQHNVEEPADRLLQVIEEATLGECEPGLARALAEDGRRAVGWLRNQ